MMPTLPHPPFGALLAALLAHPLAVDLIGGTALAVALGTLIHHIVTREDY